MIRMHPLIAAAMLATSAGALAQAGFNTQPPPPTPGTPGTPGNTGQGAVTLESLDEDGDARVSKGEARASADLSGQFSKLDRNRDGRLDAAEFARFEMSDAAPGPSGRPSGSTTRGADSSAGPVGSHDTGTDRTRQAPPK